VQQPLVLQLKVMDHQRVLFSGEVVSLSSVNEKGVFDVLESHANFITLIQERLVIRLLSGEEKVFELERGIMKVNKDVVTIFVGMELGVEEEKEKEEEDEGKDK